MTELRHIRTPLLDITYEERGDSAAPAVVLLHGFPDDARTWDAVVPALNRAGLRTLVPYLRGFGPTRFLDPGTPRSGQLSALGMDFVEFADALGLDRFVLVGHDWGARAAYVAAALHPERIRALVTLAVAYGTNAPEQPLSFAQSRAYWYQWLFGLERGRALLDVERHDFCRYLWQVWSPSWNFSDAAYAATAQSFLNPDFVEVAIHSYRHRWGGAPGDLRYDRVESKLAELPAIPVPTTLLMGAEDGATLPETAQGKERFFTGGYRVEVVAGAGHFIQRERAERVIEAILERATGA